MKLAVIADIHGNSDALRAVLNDMDRQEITQAVNLGDHFSGPMDAAGTAELMLARDFPSIRGNHDRWLIETPAEEMDTLERISSAQILADHIDWLRGLPATRTHGDIFLCHAKPTDDLTYWLEHVSPDGSVRPATLPEIEPHAAGIKASLILCAHTHIPRCVRLPDGRTILNPGSVGCPAYKDDAPYYHEMQTGSPNASYAIAEQTRQGWDVTFRSVPYDPARMIAMAHDNDHGWWETRLATGWV